MSDLTPTPAVERSPEDLAKAARDIELVEQAFGLSFAEALQHLADSALVATVAHGRGVTVAREMAGAAS